MFLYPKIIRSKRRLYVKPLSVALLTGHWTDRTGV